MTDKQEKTTLEVGDVLYGTQYGSLTSKVRIARVTNTQAITEKDIRFKREYKGWAKVIGSNAFSPTYHIESPELKVKWNKKLLKNKAESMINNLKPDAMSVEQLQKLIGFLTTL